MSFRKSPAFGPVALALVALLLAVAAVALWSGPSGAASPAPAPPLRDVVVDAPRPAPTEARAPTPDTTPDPAPRAARANGRIDVRGLVADAGGQGVASVRVLLNGPGDDDRTAQTDARGEFVALGVATGRYQIIVSGPQVLRLTEYRELAGDSGEVELALTVDRGMPYVGFVVDDADRPLAGATVTPTRQFGSWSEYDRDAAVTTDAAGRFELAGPREGVTPILVEHPDFAPAVGRLRPARSPTVRLAPRRGS
ncbi:MAG: carboxypeptidase regulatory-like domain-containing protein [Planctomycetes bacterium]|nr:carboxypeptidase regulatory-like domain-containing protein [Planctomycetota bacterium]